MLQADPGDKFSSFLPILHLRRIMNQSTLRVGDDENNENDQGWVPISHLMRIMNQVEG